MLLQNVIGTAETLLIPVGTTIHEPVIDYHAVLDAELVDHLEHSLFLDLLSRLDSLVEGAICPGRGLIGHGAGVFEVIDELGAIARGHYGLSDALMILGLSAAGSPGAAGGCEYPGNGYSAEYWLDFHGISPY